MGIKTIQGFLDVTESMHVDDVVSVMNELSVGDSDNVVINADGITINGSSVVTENNYDVKKYSQGLVYTLSEDETSYIVSGIGDCSDTEIIIPSVYKQKPVVALGDFSFYECDSFTNIIIPDSVVYIGEAAFSGCESLISVIIPNSVTEIGPEAFGGCYSLRDITISNKLTTISDLAFSSCGSLKSIAIPDSVTTINRSAFAECGSLESVTIGNSVTTIGSSAFNYCSSLNNIVIPNSVTSIGDYAFSYCEALENIVIPNNVTSIGKIVFEGCKSLTSLTLPFIGEDPLGEVGTSGLAFLFDEGCREIPSSLKTVIITGGDIVSDGAFKSCYVTNVVLPESATSIGNEAFYYCSDLTDVNIPNSLVSIDEYAFMYCNSLTHIIIPNSITTIKRYAFNSCKSLTDIYYKGTEAEWANIVIEDSNDSLVNATIHYNYTDNFIGVNKKIDAIINDLNNEIGTSIVGTWVFNESLTSYPVDNYTLNLNFEFCKDDEVFSCNYLSLYSENSSTGRYMDEVCFGNDNAEWGAYYKGNRDYGQWEGTGYNTITILEEPTDAEFIAWLKVNATKQGDSIIERLDELEGSVCEINEKIVPTCSTSNNGQFLRVVDGTPTWSTVPNAEEASF